MGFIDKFFKKSRPKAAEKHENVNEYISCPYGEVKLLKPKGTKKCKQCGQKIHRIYFPDEEKLLFVTSEEAGKIRERKKEASFLKRWYGRLKGEFGAADKDIEAQRKRLAKSGDFNERDVIWGVFNVLIQRSSSDFQQLRMIYYSMAIFLNEEGKDFSNALQAAAKMRLMEYKHSGFVKNVTISSGGGGCESCAKLDGKKFSVDEALRSMPIPNKNCTFVLHDGRKGFCRCMYLAEID